MHQQTPTAPSGSVARGRGDAQVIAPWLLRADDGIEQWLASELVERGVPKEDIVLGVRASSRRKYTEFAAS